MGDCSISMRCMDEQDAIEWDRPKNPRPWLSRVHSLLVEYAAKYGKTEPLNAILSTVPGTDLQLWTIEMFSESTIENTINFGTDHDLDQLCLLDLIGECSARQRSRLGYSWSLVPDSWACGAQGEAQ